MLEILYSEISLTRALFSVLFMVVFDLVVYTKIQKSWTPFYLFVILLAYFNRLTVGISLIVFVLYLPVLVGVKMFKSK